MKLCKDCNYYMNWGYSNGKKVRDLCDHEESITPPIYDLVITGQMIEASSRMPCHIMRKANVLCGPEGRYFKPKELKGETQ